MKYPFSWSDPPVTPEPVSVSKPDVTMAMAMIYHISEESTTDQTRRGSLER